MKGGNAITLLGMGIVCSIALIAAGPAQAEMTAVFQEGVDHGAGVYTGTSDTILDGYNPDMDRGAEEALWIDENPPNQVLIRFDDIFGNGAGQVPLGSEITTATLTLQVFDNGTTQLPVAMLQDWSESLTWNTALLGGNTQGAIQRDGVEAALVAETLQQASAGALDLDVTDIVQAWSDGQSNFGFLLDRNGTDGMGVRSSEYLATLTERPMLTVEYVPEPSTLTLLALGALAGFLLRRRWA